MTCRFAVRTVLGTVAALALPVASTAESSLRFRGTGSAAPGLHRVKVPIGAPAVPADVGASSFTLELWMKAAASENTAPAIAGGPNDAWIQGNVVLDRDVYGDGDFGDYGVSLAGGRIAFGVAVGASAWTLVGSAVVADGLWHHVALTRRASDGELRIFVDGQADGIATGPVGDASYRDGRPTTFPDSDPFLVLGAEKHDAGASFPSYSGFIDELRLSTSVRYAGAFVRPAQPFAPDTDTAALYHMDEGSGDLVLDSSGAVGGPSHGTRYFGGSPAGPEWSEDTPFGGPVVAFTVRSAVGQNTLEWLNPASGPYVSTTVRFKEATDPTACTFPSGGSDGALLERRVGTPGARDSIVHSGLTNAANTYCYGVFIEKDDGQFSAGRFVRSRPLSAAGPVHWTFGTGATAVVPTGINVLAYVVSNDRLLHAMTVGTSGGFWPAGWTPFRMNEPSQGRPTVSGVSLGGASRVAFVGSQDGHVHAVNADTGAVIWSSPLLGVPGDAIVQAAPSGIFNGVAGGTFDLVLVGTRSSAIANTFVAMNLADGSVAWRFTNALDQGGDGGAIGIVSGQAAVDVPNRRVYFASRARAGGTANTVWCLDFTGSTVTRRWARDVGNVDGSPVHRDGRVYVGTNEGLVHALDADDGTPLWSHSPVPLDGPVKGFVWPVRASSRLYFATTNRVWAIDDDGDRATSRWSLAIPSPSTTLFSGTHVYVGAGDGRLYQIDPSGAATSVALAGGPSQVGSPSMDFQNGLIYVGSDTGRIYAVAAPLP